MNTTDSLLDRYRDAVASRVFWEDHGKHGDDNPSTAIRAERIARNDLEQALKA